MKFASTVLLETCFYVQENSRKKEGIEENYITAFNTLKSGFICQLKKATLKIEFQRFKD